MSSFANVNGQASHAFMDPNAVDVNNPMNAYYADQAYQYMMRNPHDMTAQMQHAFLQQVMTRVRAH